MSTEPYTPSLDMMREWHVRADHSGNKSRAEYEAEFDRFVAKIRAEAWDEAIDFVSRHYEDYLPHRWGMEADKGNPYREQGGSMSDDEFTCGENWDHDLEFEYDDDGSWVANCKECGAELWGDTND